MDQDERNKVEVQEEIVPVRKDSRKKSIRTSSIAGKIYEVDSLKDIIVKFGNRIINLYFDYFTSYLFFCFIQVFTVAGTDAVQQGEQNKNEVYDDVVSIQRDFQKQRIRTSSIAKTGDKMFLILL